MTSTVQKLYMLASFPLFSVIKLHFSLITIVAYWPDTIRSIDYLKQSLLLVKLYLIIASVPLYSLYFFKIPLQFTTIFVLVCIIFEKVTQLNEIYLISIFNKLDHLISQPKNPSNSQLVLNIIFLVVLVFNFYLVFLILRIFQVYISIIIEKLMTDYNCFPEANINRVIWSILGEVYG